MWCKSYTMTSKNVLPPRSVIGRIAMTLFAVAVFPFLPQCDQGYATAPTFCDAWCVQENRIPCDAAFDPVVCVATCEEARRMDIYEGRGHPGRCDAPRTALLSCVQALPDSSFSCEGNRAVRRDTCTNEELGLAICQSRVPLDWGRLCAWWGAHCTEELGGVDPGDHQKLYELCTRSFSGAELGCQPQLRAVVSCLLEQPPQCDVRPPRYRGVCSAQFQALNECEPRFSGVCSSFVIECKTSAPDSGIDDFAAATEACMALRPVDVGPRCDSVREDYYDCLQGFWREIHPKRCDVAPDQVPECDAKRGAFHACVMTSADGGA